VYVALTNSHNDMTKVKNYKLEKPVKQNGLRR